MIQMQLKFQAQVYYIKYQTVKYRHGNYYSTVLSYTNKINYLFQGWMNSNIALDITLHRHFHLLFEKTKPIIFTTHFF